MADTFAERPVRRVGIARYPISSILLPVPIVCFIGALLTDFAYEGSGGNLRWVNFSSWLLAAGLLIGAITGILMLVDFARLRPLRVAQGWGAFGLLVAAWIVELINSFVHARDGWTAVDPTGLVLSIIGVVLILIYGWLWHEARYDMDGGQA